MRKSDDLKPRNRRGAKVLNDTTRVTFRKTDAGKELVVCKDAGEMFRKLGI